MELPNDLSVRQGVGFPGKALKLIVYLFGLVGILVATVTVFATPSQIKGDPAEPFKPNQYVLSERVSFLFRDPRIGDAVIFSPSGEKTEFIGLIINISENENGQPYTIISGQRKSWNVSRYDILRKIYYPRVSSTDIENAQSSFLITPSPSPNPEEPLPTIDVGPSGTPVATPTIRPAPTAVPVGSVSGETNVGYGNFQKTIAGVDVTATGDKITSSTKTSEDGKYSIGSLPVGYYTISFSHPDYSFGNLKVEVKIGNNPVNSSFGLLKNPKPMHLSISVFADTISNGRKDSGEQNLNATISIQKKFGNDWQSYRSFSGDYVTDIIESGDYRIEPMNYTYYTKPAAQSFTVDGYGGSKTIEFAYKPTVSVNGFVMYVFNDKNENATKDAGEEYIHYQYAKVTHASSEKTSNIAISETGAKDTYIEPGTYSVQLIPENSSWDYYYKITKGYYSVNVTTWSEQQTVELGAHKL